MTLKKCPHCGCKLGFLTFVTRYGSDTLVKHSPAGHKREHVCLKCGQKLWLYYNPFHFKSVAMQYSLASLLFCWFAAIIFLKPAFNFDLYQTAIFTLILLGLTLPMVLWFSKYESASFNEEHFNKRSH